MVTKSLGIWSNGVHVGHWRVGSPGNSELQYASTWVNSALGRPLSLSLPMGMAGLPSSPLRGPAVDNYFDNLLPDSEQLRQRVASRYGAASLSPFDLLERIGRDCVGAVQLLPEGETPKGLEKIEGDVLSDEAVAQYLDRALTSNTLGSSDISDDDVRISLAGAQEKTALLKHKNQWIRPRGSTPTSHILKLPLGLVGHRRIDLSQSVDNEWVCLNLLAEAGIPSARCEIHTFGTRRVLAVERFDRKLHPSGNWWLRLPQEDFCQVLGKPRHLKYEADGGPGLADIAKVLRHSETALADLKHFYLCQVAFWLLAAPDGHAKNFSIHLLPQGRYRLTPAYDVISIWPMEGSGPNQWSWFDAKLAMALPGKNKHYRMKDIQKRHFLGIARPSGLQSEMETWLQSLLSEWPLAVDRLRRRLPDSVDRDLAERIFTRSTLIAEQVADAA